MVPWAERFDEFMGLRDEAESDGINGAWMRRAQSLSVSLYRPRQDHPAWGVLIPAKLRRTNKGDRRQDAWFILEDPHATHYDNTLGLVLPQAEQVFIG